MRELGQIFGFGARVDRLLELEIPVAGRAQLRAIVDSGFRIGPRSKQLDVLEKGALGEEVLERQIFYKPIEIDLGTVGGMLDDCLDFRAEQQGVPAKGIVQRFDAIPVAREVKPLIVLVVDGESEHAIEPLQCGRHSPYRNRLEQHFRVGARLEAYAQSLQVRAQLQKVVDLAVVRQGVAAIFGGHRLKAGIGQVDDGQPTVTEGSRAIDPETFAIGTAVGDGAGHVAHMLGGGRLTVEMEDARDAAHVVDPSRAAAAAAGKMTERLIEIHANGMHN